ncbi:hypothetical protein [Mycobacterium intracellulare]|uniref:hypothetical protein n=1 Tax=Mycobacterium intracellulare TaxID=1767 RepID=UPI000BAF5EAE|nr:hypothetical protein [Mycobacterium intracellulare]PBA57190.1 hypothetical protein CKJ57_22465 [Mycobacterium intracellulare subsp. chimaera]
MNITSVDRPSAASAPPAPRSDPFDFSDLGGRTTPVSSPDAHSRSLAPSRTGFDPFAGQAPATAQTSPQEIFAAPGSSGLADTIGVAGPPLRLLGAGFVAAALGVLLGAFSMGAAAPGPTALLAFAGWLLAGPTAIGVLACFSSLDTRRRLSSVYSAPAWLRNAYWILMATCATGIGVGAWELALWAGRF